MDNLTGKLGMSGKIVELISASSSIQIPTDPGVDISAIIGDDYEPMFAVVEVIRAGVSGNDRRYGNPVVQQIHSMITGVQGFLGHKDPEKSHFEFREPQSIYVGSKIEEMGNGMMRVLGKSYIFKNSKLREWIPKSIAAGNPLTVSIYGDGDVIRGSDGILEVLKMTSLESIDWANPGTQGMSTSQAVAVVSELKDEPKGGNEPMERQEVVSGVTISEVKAFNPTLINSAIAGVTIAELKENNADLYNSIVESAKITEMKLKIGDAEKVVKLDDVQDILDARDATIAEMKNNEAKAKLETFKSTKIAEMVDEKYREKISARVTGSTEDEITASIKAESTYIAEMIGTGVNNPPAGSGANVADYATALGSMKNAFGVKEKESK